MAEEIDAEKRKSMGGMAAAAADFFAGGRALKTIGALAAVEVAAMAFDELFGTAEVRAQTVTIRKRPKSDPVVVERRLNAQKQDARKALKYLYDSIPQVKGMVRDTNKDGKTSDWKLDVAQKQKLYRDFPSLGKMADECGIEDVGVLVERENGKLVLSLCFDERCVSVLQNN